jgi:DNA-binding LacI/PurR family transcriptional regulator
MSKSQEIKSWVLDEIKKGTFDKNAPLPGDLELMNRFGVSRGTVRLALFELQRQGLIKRRRGKGTFLSRQGMRKSGVIGVLFPELDTCEYFRDIERELVAYGRRLGYEIDVRKCAVGRLGDVAGEMCREVQSLAGGHAEGVIFRPLINEKYMEINRKVAKILEEAEKPVVLFDSDVERKPHRSVFDIVTVNNVDAGRSVAEYLISTGRKRIAFNMFDCVEGKNENLDNRFFGVAGECVVRGLYDGVRSVTIAPSDSDAVRKLLRSRWRPDALVCVNDEIAVGLVRTLIGLGIDIPKDVAVVGFDDVSCARLSVPPLTTVRQPSRQLAQTLLKTLLFRLRSQDAPPQEIYLAAPLVCRGTA